MKKYILVSIVLIFSISFITYYAFRWSEINREVKQYTQIEEFSYELELLNQNQKLLINSLRTNYNYDAIAKSTIKMDNAAKEFIYMLVNTDDAELIKYSKAIQYKTKKLNYYYEDIKTDTAEIKNSLKWLSAKYNKHLIGKKDYNSSEIELIRYIFNLLSITAQNDIFINIKPFKGEANKLNIPRLGTHLDIIYYEYNKLMSLKKKLDKNDILPDLKIVENYVKGVQKELHNEISYIIKSLLIASIFLVLYGVIIYIREAYAKLETEELKNELGQFANALNQSAIVSKTDVTGRITFVNDRFCQVSGYTREELIGKAHNIVRHPDMSKEVFADLWESIQNKNIFKATIKNRKKNGEPYYVDTVVVPLLGINDELNGYLAVRYEVTELVEGRDKAIVAEKAKDEFLSNMSHELRTPLNAIKGFSSILNKQVKSDKHSGYLTNIIDSSEHLIGLINDILDVSKLQSGKFSLDYHDFNVDEKISLFLNRFEAQLKIAELKMNFDLDSSIKTTLHGDWLRISQIITNLVSNAIKFTPKGKSIDFSAKYENGKLIIIVEDRGIGISEEAQAKIFEPFEQADSSTTRVYGGTGLGLSIILNLIEQMQGEINLTSKEGEGSKFEVILPLKESQYIIQEIIEEEDDSTKKLNGHILIAEDNKTNQMLIGILVDELGLTYTMADDGLDAVDKFSKDKFDLVLMDENMPNLNGTEAMKKIRTQHGDTTPPIIALTANVMQGDKEKFLEAGMDGYISKPIEEKELYRVLKSFLNNKS